VARWMVSPAGGPSGRAVRGSSTGPESVVTKFLSTNYARSKEYNSELTLARAQMWLIDHLVSKDVIEPVSTAALDIADGFKQ
jgi:hypothetical protein